MNERIKELANSAYYRSEYDNGNVHECYEFSVDELEKFVELIVKECAWLSTDKTDRNAMLKYFGIKNENN